MHQQYWKFARLEMQLLAVFKQLLPSVPDGRGVLQSLIERVHALDFSLPVAGLQYAFKVCCFEAAAEGCATVFGLSWSADPMETPSSDCFQPVEL